MHPGSPTLDVLEYDTDGRSVRFTLPEDVYPRDALLGAAYLFVQRCFVFLDQPAPGRVEVRLKAREALSREALADLAGDFANELLNQVLRARLAESTALLREYTLARALRVSAAGSAIDALLAEIDAEDLEDDELEIQVPWEEAHGDAAPVGEEP